MASDVTGMINPLRFGLLLSLLAVTSYYGLLHYRVLQIGHPITQDEPGFVEITAGGNAYTETGVTTCANVYGPGYALWARPFTALIPNAYIAHRWASSCALFGLLGILAWVLRGEGVGGIETAAGLAIVYILNVSSHSLSANADLLGTALFVATLAVSRRGTWPALLAGLILAALAALTKPYFALGWGIVVSHLFLFGPPRRAFAYLGLSVAVAAVVAAVLNAVAPFYYLATVVFHRAVAGRHADILVGQTLAFAVLTSGVLILACLDHPVRRQFSVALDRPWISPAVDLWNWAAVLAAIALLGMLGWHAGNYLVYFYHLLLAPLVVVALRRLATWPRAGRVLLWANVAVLGFLIPPLPGRDHWENLEASVADVHGPILADPLLEPFVHSHPYVTLLTHGHTVSIVQAMDHMGADVPAAYLNVQRDLQRIAQNLNARIRAQEFAAVYIVYVDLGAGATWGYDQSHIRQSLFTRYQPASDIVVYPYAAPYWDRMHHGQSPYHVIKWVPKLVPARDVAQLH